MFSDNQGVHTNGTVPHSQSNKRHNALAYHRVREAIAAKIMNFYKIDGKKNPSDILSKHSGYTDAWPYVKPFAVLAWQYVSDSRQRGVTESNRDWKHGSHWLVRLGCYDRKIYLSHRHQQN